ncbi:MAG: hypothetical protein CVU48_06915 [Candidatus Cloacimonetes bacterium HGW-Cloacimonetes-1]|nr:MAG: hypothetical protein CVU48_06915 [Candidatus Cloacimonetes bacterium HGW-Cloacimonetes-1]
MKKAITIILLIAVMLSLQSCKYMFMKPSIKQIHDIRVKSITPDQVNLIVSLEVNNPNRYHMRLEETEINLLNKDRQRLGYATLSKSVLIPGKKSINLEFLVSLNTRQVTKLISISKQSVYLYIEGSGKGSVLGITKHFAFEEPYEFALGKQIETLLPKFSSEGQDLFKILRTTVDNVSLTETTVRVDFLLLNPFGLTFRFVNFPSDIYINDKLAGKGSLEKPLSFDENIFYQEGTLIFKVSNMKTIVGAAKGLLKGEIGYVIKGHVKATAFGVEIDKPYQLKDSFPLNVSQLLF